MEFAACGAVHGADPRPSHALCGAERVTEYTHLLKLLYESVKA